MATHLKHPALRSSQDRFQAAFWKLRQAEYEPYLLQRSPLRTKQVGSCTRDLHPVDAAMPVLLPACMHACLLAMLAQGLGALYSLCADFRPVGVIMLEQVLTKCDARPESRLPGITASVSLVRECWLQGDLTDPSYFDFISFAQLATISREIPKGQQEFEVCNRNTNIWLFCSASRHAKS